MAHAGWAKWWTALPDAERSKGSAAGSCSRRAPSGPCSVWFRRSLVVQLLNGGCGLGVPSSVDEGGGRWVLVMLASFRRGVLCGAPGVSVG